MRALLFLGLATVALHAQSRAAEPLTGSAKMKTDERIAAYSKAVAAQPGSAHLQSLLARAYIQTFPATERRSIPVRFDVVSVYALGRATEFEIFEGAFGWR